MNIFTIIGVVVVVLFLVGYLGFALEPLTRREICSDATTGRGTPRVGMQAARGRRSTASGWRSSLALPLSPPMRPPRSMGGIVA